MRVVFFAPTLQPLVQSPHRLQRGCVTPKGFTWSTKFTAIGGRLKGFFIAAADFCSASSLFSGGKCSESSG